MSLSAGESVSICDLNFHGLSLSGIRTSISVPELHICFDVAQGFPFHFNIKNFFITHGHLDHAAGIPYIISQKAMNSMAAPNFYMPESLIAPLDEIMKAWQKIEDHTYQYHFLPMGNDEKVYVSKNHFVKKFKTLHRIPSNGYTVYESKHKLKDIYRHSNSNDLVNLKKKNIEIHDNIESPLISFTGDTQIEFLDLSPEVKKSKVLFVECTYFDDRRSVDHARKWGHTHWFELKNRLSEIEAEKIVLIHLSARYSTREAIAILQNNLSGIDRDRVVLFPGR